MALDPAVQAQIQALTDEVTQATTVETGAATLISSIPALIQAAVDKVIANGGATAADLQPLTDLGTALKAQSDALAAAMVANTPAARKR